MISSPRRWGKSLNLSMIQAFLQPDGDDPNHYINKNINDKYDFNTGNKYNVFFEGGEIENII